MTSRLLLFSLVAALLCSCSVSSKQTAGTSDNIIILAYVTSWSNVMPDPTYLTHINYAFGHVTDDFKAMRIDNEEKLVKIIALKKQKPSLKVMLSVGGWESGRFSEMAADPQNRESFAQSCAQAVKRLNLDGIDIDWEYPSSSMAGISSSPEDIQNYTLLMRDLRKALGEDALLTHATSAGAEYYDFKAIDKYIDFTNVMSYDLGWAPYHNSPLYRSKHVEEISADDAVKAHLSAGVPASKLVMGLAFYGHYAPDSHGVAGLPRQRDLNRIKLAPGFTQEWDDQAKVPFIQDAQGNVVFSYENSRSLSIKAQYILDNKLKGAMYWSYEGDNPAGELLKSVHSVLGNVAENN